MKQCTVYNNALSSLTSNTFRISQGQILGPILFLLYINDITRCINKLKFLLFAYDTTIFIQGQNLIDIEKTLNAKLSLSQTG